MTDPQKITQDLVIESLKKVSYPGFSRDIVSFGLLDHIQIDDQSVKVFMKLKSADHEKGVQIEEFAKKQLLADYPGMQIEVSVEMQAPQQSEPQDKVQTHFLENIKYKVAVASGKGGVGKSTVAVNLAVALAKTGWSVGLLDADIYGPSIPLMVGIDEKPPFDGQKIHPIEKYNVQWMSIGFLVDNNEAVIWRGALVHRALQQLMNDVAWPDLDIILFDMPPGTGDAQLTLSQSIALDGAVIVSTPQDVALVDAVKGVQMFRKVNVPIMGLIENMSYFICPGCGTRTDIFSSGGANTTSKKIDVELLGEIPINTAIRAGGDAGAPVALENNTVSEAFIEVAERIKNKLLNR
ncbi:MAG: Mrp/NBP35 family ATP-binding protein [Calditrichaceae bacterium]|nr:Mrp/NBP35 family ATP-binding protein [Calditrichaceae bacterium]MBN2707440.1 Mrp/NBP35 family ATP-binding protein [Calditrichaceae bacterium]RQV94008.1 MAG: ATP-binding protein [Calditrichota bacterium]